MIEIRLYDTGMQDLWNETVAVTRNATFMHNRQYMDYHSDRFADFSLMAFAGGKPIALLPANRVDNTLWSHQGLTYGGWLMTNNCDAVSIMNVMAAATRFLKDWGIDEIVYKAVPHIYHRYPAEEDLYAIFCHGAQLTESSLSASIDLTNAIGLDRGNRSSVNQAHRNGIEINGSNDIDGYWNVLSEVLQERHDTLPVHTAEEMKLLMSRFPENIKLFTATVDNEILAGTVMYLAGPTAHSQYIASSSKGRELKALPLLFDTLIKTFAERGFRYFDFGISCENHGKILNEGLVTQKNRLGGRGIVYNTYRIKL